MFKIQYWNIANIANIAGNERISARKNVIVNNK